MASVLIVGAGPVGLTLAIELARYGVSVRIVERASERSDKSKALVVWPRTLELLDRSGASAGAIAAGNRISAVNIVAAGNRIAHVSFDTVASPHPYALMLPQYDTERLLEEFLLGLGVRVERGLELTALAAASDGVNVTLAGDAGSTETVRADWLAACDGAHSVVRHALDMPFTGEVLPGTSLLAEVRLSGVRTPDDEMDFYLHRDGPLALFPFSAGRYRIIAEIPGGPGGPGAPGEPEPEPELAAVQSLLDERGPGGITANDPRWLAAFRVNERKVADFRSGRVFLAGDAAHVHSPAGGQGMNTGMQDACNLAWKLALVCAGTCSGEALLESYSIERSAVAATVLAESGRLTALVTLKNEALQAVRNHVAALLFGIAPFRAAVAGTMTEVSLAYDRSGLTWSGKLAVGPAAGARAPLRPGERPVGAGPAPRFALFADAGPEAAGLLGAYPALLEPTVRPPFEAGGMWLVRPDGYVGVVAERGAISVMRDYLDSLG
jgi:2-polyprenyl-6-methoxyphenol hydroxylase-like FAD-dependent oxidoreductase